MLATERLSEIEATFAAMVQRIVTLETFPHHKHIERQENLKPSKETCLEKVMQVIVKYN